MGEDCESNGLGNNDRYDLHITTISITTILFISIFVHTMHHEITNRNDEKFQKVKFNRMLFIAMQVLVMTWLFNDILRYAIDPHTHILQDSIFCKICAWASITFTGWFFGLYLFQVFPLSVSANTFGDADRWIHCFRF